MSTTVTDVSLESVQAAVDEVLEGAFHTFAESNGFSLKGGDVMLVPKGFERHVPKSLLDKGMVRRSSLVTSVVLMKGTFLEIIDPVDQYSWERPR